MTMFRVPTVRRAVHRLKGRITSAHTPADPRRPAMTWRRRLPTVAAALVVGLAGMVVLTVPAGASSGPVVTAVDASIGSTAGGDTVDVVGTDLTGTTEVDFGTTPATTFTVDSATQLTAVTPAVTTGIVDVTVTTPQGTSPATGADLFSYQPVPPSVYTANFGDGDITPINTATDTAGSPIAVGGYPIAIAISPGGSTTWTADYGDGTVSPVDTATGVAGAPITVGAYPDAIAITPDGSTAYVANDGDGTVTPIDTATDTAGSPITVGRFPSAIAVTPDGSTAYVANDGDGTVTPIDTATGTAGSPIGVGRGPVAIAITPDGSTAYVADIDGATVTPIDIATETAGDPIPVGNSPASVAIAPDGSTAYVADFGGTTLTPIDTTTDATGSPITVGTGPRAVAISPDGSTGYVAMQNGDTVVPVDLATGATATPIPVGDSPIAVAVSYVTPLATVTGVSPDNGSTAGGTSVTITGTGFVGATGADIGTGNGCTTDFTVVSATTITCTTPAGAAGNVDVTVTTPQGTSGVDTPGDGFTYEGSPTVTGVDPDNGPTAGGTAVTLTGTGFVGATAVDVGTGNACTTGLTVVSVTSITCTTPAGPAGTVDVTVTTPQGTSEADPPGDGFTYVPPPSTQLVFSTGPTDSVAGTPLATQPQVTVEDASGDPVVADVSSVTLSITPSTPTTGGPGTLTGCVQSGEVAGVVSFAGCEIDTTGTGYQLHATDGALTAADSGPFAVSAGPAADFTVSTPTTATAGTPFGVTVTALDADGNTAAGYRGTVHVTSSDGGAFLPTDYTFVAGDGGVHTFASGVTLATVGRQTVTATDSVTSSITGTSGPITVSPAPQPYWLVASDGGIFAYGGAGFYGSAGDVHLNRPIVGMASTLDGRGYWLVASDGGIFTYGDAGFYGSAGDVHLDEPIVGMASTADGKGYWLVASDGGVFAYGDAVFYGSAGDVHLNEPIVGMASTADGKGYWLVASDGGVFAYGDARFLGSAGDVHLNEPIVGMAPTADGDGYWLVASDGGVFAYGDAVFYGSAGDVHLSEPIVGMATSPEGKGYWLVASDGGIFAYGDARFTGSGGTGDLNDPVVGMAAAPTAPICGRNAPGPSALRSHC